MAGGGLRLHGMARTTNTLRVIAVLDELGLDYDLVPVDLASGDHKLPQFLSLNPFGQIPVMEDGDVVIYESRAITRYLVMKHRPELLVTGGDNAAAATAEVAMQVEAHQFGPPAAALLKELIFKPKRGLAADPAVVAAEAEKLGKVLDVYEARLGAGGGFIAGGEVSLADLHHLPAMHYLMISPERELVASRPRVLAWYQSLSGRPAWKKTVEVIPAV